MVGMNPAKFYGRLLPRPRIYCDVKFNESRVDPPEPVNAALLEWARETSWKMGGTAQKRKRMSGKVEGRMNKLRDMEESDNDDDDTEPPPPTKSKVPAKLSFEKNKREKHLTPIERMLESPARVLKRGTLAPRRIISDEVPQSEQPVPEVQPRARRRSRKEPVVPASDDDSDDGIEEFVQQLQQADQQHTPRRGIRKSSRLQASPTPNPNSTSPQASPTPNPKSTSLQASPTPNSKSTSLQSSPTPNSKRPARRLLQRPSQNTPRSGDGRRSLIRKLVAEDSGPDSELEQSESVFL